MVSDIKDSVKDNAPWVVAISILLILSVMYFYYGMQNSFIPYSTAWDANHEYLYLPKIIAENAGIYWGNFVGSWMPGLWHIFITYFFSLSGITNGFFGLSEDTVAVAMNFWSALLVLILGVGLICQMVELLQQHEKEKDTEYGKL